MLDNILPNFAPKGLDMLKEALSKRSVTGKTVDSLKFVVTKDRLTYSGRAFMETLEKGRGPRKETSYGEFDKNLEEWLKAKGFEQKKSKKGITYYKLGEQWFSAKSLAWKINKDGDKQFRSKQTKDVYSSVVEEIRKELTMMIQKDAATEFKEKVLASLR